MSLGLILQLIESGKATLVNSAVLEFENSRNRFALRREWMTRCLRLATEYQRVAVHKQLFSGESIDSLYEQIKIFQEEQI